MKYLPLIILTALCSFVLPAHNMNSGKLKMPYKAEGLTDRQAAAHLLSRLTFGARPGDIDAVVKEGLNHWAERQLDATAADEDVQQKLARFDALNLDDETIVNRYLNAGQVLQFAQKNGLYKKDTTDLKNPALRAELKKFMDEKGLKAPQEMIRQVISQKIIRAVYGENQLKEVLTDFWFNHFNVSFTKGQAQNYILTYERDVIRPHVLDNFEDLLLATAKHPAMLLYLDNAQSVSDDNAMGRRLAVVQQNKRGLNENYAREVMELHTLGVDGGYTQKDVTELARALTGWTVRPLNKDGAATKIVDAANENRMQRLGFIVEGNFLFRANKHDEGEKQILALHLPAHGGYQEGVDALKMLASHPSTAKFICTKLATRFVSDTPSTTLVADMVSTFEKTHGDIKQVMISMLNNREFWKKDVVGKKIKSPFELIVSAVRATHANMNLPLPLYNWCDRMGQKIYSYQAPTGFPDRASYWVNTGALLNRMNFGLDLAGDKILGVRMDLKALNDNHEPGSVDEALVAYSNILLTERDQQQNIQRLSALANDPGVQQKIADMASKEQARNKTMMESDELTDMSQKNQNNTMMNDTHKMIAHVVGIILGSPEFQRK